MRFGLMRIERPEVFWHDILLTLPFLYVVLLEHSVPQKIAVCDVV